MRRPSPHTAALIQRLIEPVSFRERLLPRNYAAMLSEIADSNEPSAIVEIVPFVLSETSVAFAAANAVHKLLRGTTVNDLAWLDSALRVRSPYAGEQFYEWHKMSPSQIGRLERFGDASISVLGLASFHQSGYVREAAIERLSLITTGAEVPFLILRLNDWVSNVRDASYNAVRSRLKPEYCRSFIANFALLSRLEYAGRADHKQIIQEINGLLRSHECRAVLLESLKSEDRFVRRASFRLALESTDSDLQQIVRLALSDPDTVVRTWAARRVSTAFEGRTLHQFLELMKRDRFMPVRREALRIAVKLTSPQLHDELRTALLDAHVSMREESRYHSRLILLMDFAAFYRQHLTAAEPRTLYSAISGLGETGKAEDDRLIVPYTSHALSKIRRAAVRALANLNRETHLDVFIEALKDDVPSVSRQGLEALADQGFLVSAARAWELFKTAPHDHVKVNALSLIESLSKWDSIGYLVRALCDADEAIVEMSRSGIQRWLARFNRSFSSPTAEQIAKLRSALEECGNRIDEATQEQLWFSLRGFS